jgi:CRISPR/Cas system CMR-associated protein Cmr5 small subunit
MVNICFFAFLEQKHDTTEIVSATFTNIDNHHQNFIFAIETNPCKYMLMNYLTLRDIIPFGFTCKILYVKVFQQEETWRLKRFCTVDIPAYVVPHVTKN